jgi:DnaK suppressor protein
MDPARARELLERERTRIEGELGSDESQTPLESSRRREPGDRASEDLYEDELSEARSEQLQDELAAVRRAEERLAAGTFGISIESGEPIPDERLEAVPTAERTVAEEARYRG